VLADGAYFISISGVTTDGDTFASENCSQVQVTHSFAECTEDTGMSVVVAGKNVTAYIPAVNRYVGGDLTGINVIPIEGDGADAVIPTPTPIISCASNPATGQTVCVSWNTPDVYEITGTTITNTVQTAGQRNVGVVMNALTNMAVISTTSPDLLYNSAQSMQMLDLSSNTLTPAFSPVNPLSQLALDPSRNIILSGSSLTLSLFDTSSTGTPTQYGNTLPMLPIPFDPRFFAASAVDCSTGIAFAAVKDPSVVGQLYIGDLTQATFTPPSGSSPAGTWIAPQQLLGVSLDIVHAGGPNISIAAGTSHLGFLSAAFAYYPFGRPFGFTAIRLPSTSGSGIPSLVDYATADWPVTFEADQLTTYTSPNDGRVYGIVANQGFYLGEKGFYPLASVAVVDLQLLLDAPRTPGTHAVDPTYDLQANGAVRYITVPSP
jgi:hypothetical protein